MTTHFLLASWGRRDGRSVSLGASGVSDGAPGLLWGGDEDKDDVDEDVLLLWPPKQQKSWLRRPRLRGFLAVVDTESRRGQQVRQEWSYIELSMEKMKARPLIYEGWGHMGIYHSMHWDGEAIWRELEVNRSMPLVAEFINSEGGTVARIPMHSKMAQSQKARVGAQGQMESNTREREAEIKEKQGRPQLNSIQVEHPGEWMLGIR